MTTQISNNRLSIELGAVLIFNPVTSGHQTSPTKLRFNVGICSDAEIVDTLVARPF